ncbi:VOC family protein [Brevibacillus sp. TJ4]|uniref:VOC family protein n=1 Tax=Brevibacillus sp. TJ4 TaxID=3234853 RepID=UPI0037D547BB
MDLAFDHVVHFLRREPAEAAAAFAVCGFHTVPGGRHLPWGTWNALSYFDLSYVEFFAVEQAEIASKSDNPLVRQLVDDSSLGEGFGQIALRTTQMDEWARRLMTKDLSITGPLQGSRMREDGTEIRWRMLFVETGKSGFRPPFLIEWAQPDEERRADLSLRGVIASHPNETRVLAGIGYAVHDLEQAAQRWKNWFAGESSPVFYDVCTDAWCTRFSLPGADVCFCQPKGEGLAFQALRTRGERPFIAWVKGGETAREWQVCGGLYRTE